MTRLPLLAAALTLTLSAPQAAFALTAPEAPAPSPARPGDDEATALRELKADAVRAVRVQRDEQGDVAFVSSTDGRAMLESDASGPRRSAQDQLAKYGEAFGVDGVTSKAVTKQTHDSATGGTVVRAEQVVDGVPVFGGQLVMSLDEDQGVVSVASATTDATQVPDAVVSDAQARRTALAVTAKHHGVPAGQLSVTSEGRRLYDPDLVHLTDPGGTRPVWQLEVTNGSDVRETVLVGTGRGEIALRFNDAPHLNRRVCDNKNVRTVATDVPVPICATPARAEGGAASGILDVNKAYDSLGATSNTYAALDGIDLTQLIGATVSGQKTLQATVRWCFSDEPCPFANAFWDGTQMVFGAGYAAADDVVAHELTHGYVERTSGLFYLHQSGAINESLADTIGEIVDHRNPLSPASDANWTLGEDLPGGGVLRSLKNPPLYGQPDKMTSPNFVTADFDWDSGAVHDNDGVGNKTAYLISQGGSFNGQNVTGIDTGDTGLAKTGRLYLETIPRLTSGADYAQLGDVLASTCQQLAVAGTGGFTPSDCTSVSAAVAATELSTPPTDAVAAAPKVAVGCPTGSPLVVLKRDDDTQQDFDFTLGTLWQRTPDSQIPDNTASGSSTLFGWNPDPLEFDDPPTSAATTAGFTVPDGPRTYLNFQHAYLFEFGGTQYYDGGQALVQRLVDGTWTTVIGLPWVNGATKTRYGTSTKVFGGDSHGYGSSQVDLTSLAGQTVRFVLQVEGDNDGSYWGWWVDDIRLYACEGAPAPVAPTAPTTASAVAGVTSAVVSWQPPADSGTTPITSYRITRSNGKVNTAPATARSLTLTGLAANTAVTVSVAAVNQEGLVGAASTVPIYGTATTVTAPARVRKGQLFTVTAKVVRRGTTSVISGMPVTLQRRVKGSTLWRAVSSSTTSAAGTRSWSVKQSSVTSYRVVSKGVRTYLGTTSALRTVLLR